MSLPSSLNPILHSELVPPMHMWIVLCPHWIRVYTQSCIIVAPTNLQIQILSLAEPNFTFHIIRFLWGKKIERIKEKSPWRLKSKQNTEKIKRTNKKTNKERINHLITLFFFLEAHTFSFFPFFIPELFWLRKKKYREITRKKLFVKSQQRKIVK